MQNRYYQLYAMSEGQATELDPNSFLNLLRRIPQYSTSCEYDVRTFDITRVQVLCRSVSKRRLSKAKRLFDLYRQSSIEPFRPLELRFGEQVTQFIFPPIVHIDIESRACIVMDGMHRLFVSKNIGLVSPIVLAVTGPLQLLPGEPLSWPSVDIVDGEVPVNEKFVNFRPAAFQHPYTATFNGETFWSDQDADRSSKKIN